MVSGVGGSYEYGWFNVCVPTTNRFKYDEATGQYTAVGTGGASTDGSSTAAEGAIAATEAAVFSAAAAAAERASAVAERKRGAVIGAAPQLSSQGLLAAVQQLDVSVLLLSLLCRDSHIPCDDGARN